MIGQADVMPAEPIQEEISLIAEATSLDILEVLGQGGFGTVYRAYHRDFGKFVAVKVLKRQFQLDRETVERFLLEARLCAKLLCHENIVSVYSLSQLPDGSLYMVMEYVPGKTLRFFDEQLRLAGWRQILMLGEQMLQALAHAHRQGILHRDLKPDNILLVPGDRPTIKILDFGLAKLLSSGQNLTATGHIIGTPRYMGPERITGEGADARSDIFAAGVILYELLTGSSPVDTDDIQELVLGFLYGESVKPIGNSVPRSLEMAILKAIQPNPNDRYQSVEEFGEALALIEQAPEAIPKEVAIRSSHSLDPKYSERTGTLQSLLIWCLVSVVTIVLVTFCLRLNKEQDKSESLRAVVNSIAVRRTLRSQLESTSDADIEKVLEKRLSMLTSFGPDQKMFSTNYSYADSLDEEFEIISLTAWRHRLPELAQHAAIVGAIVPWHFARYCRSERLKSIALAGWKAAMSQNSSCMSATKLEAEFAIRYLERVDKLTGQHDEQGVHRIAESFGEVIDKSSSDPVFKCLAWLGLAQQFERLNRPDQAAPVWAKLVGKLVEINPDTDGDSNNYYFLLVYTSQRLHDLGMNDLALIVCKRRFEVACARSGPDSTDAMRSLSFSMACKNYRQSECSSELRRLRQWIATHQKEPDPHRYGEHINILVETGTAICDIREADHVLREAQALLDLVPNDADAIHSVFGARFSKLFNTADYNMLHELLLHESKALETTDNPNYVAKNLLELCQLNTKYQRYDEAAKEALAAKSLLEQNRLNDEAVGTIAYVATVYAKAGNLQKACSTMQTYFDQVSRHSYDSRNIGIWIHTTAEWRFQACELAWMRNQPDTALQEAIAARDLVCKRLPNDFMYCSTACYLAKALWLVGRKEEAKQTLTNTMAQLRKHGAPSDQMQAVNNFLNSLR